MSVPVRSLSHVGIAVPDLDAAIRCFRERFGCRVTGPFEAAAQEVRIAYVELENARVELLTPTAPDSPLAKFLARHPAGGLHHLALGVDDTSEAAAAAISEGFRILGSGAPVPGHHGRPIFFLDPKAVFGALTEIEQEARP
ncbi:MAG TPA: methylmalonyl-CoA epimerase [Xanthobacteraceae bacterium]|nr:methylmalonyl-CoA epimerase [Xanthobacteraceae bacterium]